MLPRPTIEAFDLFLAERGLSLEATVIGGAALVLLGVAARQTRDFDILHPTLPFDILKASQEFSRSMRAKGIPLQEDWLNNGPSQLANTLPLGWRERRVELFLGKSLCLFTLGRADLLKSKLFALCDRGSDFSDCLALNPTAAELEEAAPWVAFQDAHPDWPRHVHDTLENLRRRLTNGVQT